GAAHDDPQGGQLGDGRGGQADGDGGQGEDGGGGAPPPRAEAQGPAEADAAGQEGGHPAGQEQGVGQVEGVEGVADGVLEPGGQGDDAEQQRQGPVAERRDRHGGGAGTG